MNEAPRGAGPADIRRIFREFPARLADLTCEGAEPACGRKARRAFRAVCRAGSRLTPARNSR